MDLISKRDSVGRNRDAIAAEYMARAKEYQATEAKAKDTAKAFKDELARIDCEMQSLMEQADALDELPGV
jgi:hypothetical protein